MGLFDNALGSLTGGGGIDITAIASQLGIDIDAIAAKVGLTPDQVTAIMNALGVAHEQPGDTTVQAAEQTGLPLDKVKAVVTALGGEDAIAKISGMLGGLGDISGALGKF